MKYKIALHQSEEGFSVSVPGLPGCWSQGATEEEAVKKRRFAKSTSRVLSPCPGFQASRIRRRFVHSRRQDFG